MLYLCSMKEQYWEKSKLIKIPALGRDVRFVYTNDIPASRIAHSKKLGELDYKIGKNVDGLCAYNDDELYMFISPKATLGVVSHEVYHVVCRMFDYIGVEDYDEELVAYHLGYIVDEVYKFIQKINKEFLIIN